MANNDVKVKIENIEDDLDSLSMDSDLSTNYNTKSEDSLNKVINGRVCDNYKY